jgi:hypothetical protein
VADKFPSLSQDNFLVIFTTAPTGLGHIRVMDGIKDGLAPSVQSVSIGVDNINANKIHSLGSRIPLFNKLTEFSQTNKIAEFIVTKIYVNYLQSRKKETLESLASVALDYPDKRFWVIISTHYALAYSILAAKRELENNFNVKIFLCVVVTDDSPQRVWAVKNADLIFTPSMETFEGLKNLGINAQKLRVVSFPISPKLTIDLTKTELEKSKIQLSPDSKELVHIEIPVSGAAVQLNFMEKVIEILSKDLFRFTIIGKSSSFTIPFFERVLKFPHTQTSIGSSANQTVDLYESIFSGNNRPLVEITKPSEQAFKAILSPNKRGGVILLLTDPVGRQEKDNLNFLIRNKLMPNPNEKINWDNFNYRAIKLPSDPVKAAKFIKELKEKGIFLKMLNYRDENKKELTSDGVKQIWEEINGYLDSLKANGL